VLTDAAINCRSDKLQGLKGESDHRKLIPAVPASTGTATSRCNHRGSPRCGYTIPPTRISTPRPDFGQARSCGSLDDYGYSDYRSYNEKPRNVAGLFVRRA